MSAEKQCFVGHTCAGNEVKNGKCFHYPANAFIMRVLFKFLICSVLLTSPMLFYFDIRTLTFYSNTNCELPVKDHIWQPVLGTKHRFKVYSAFVDVRNKQKPIVRLIADNINPGPDKVFCKFYYQNGITGWKQIIHIFKTIQALSEKCFSHIICQCLILLIRHFLDRVNEWSPTFWLIIDC